MPGKFKNKYRVDSARLASWDYSNNGSYFITTCTAKRKHYFGEIIKGEMHLSVIGKYAHQCWMQIPEHFSFVWLDEFVVMPDHLHGIIAIDKPIETGHAVETGHAPSVHCGGKPVISSIVGSFKSAVTKWCNENNLSFGWQSRFHDRIIRDNDEWERIRNYIINNPANWLSR